MAGEHLTDLQTPLLVQRALALARDEPVLESDDYWAHVRVLHRRSGREAYEEAAALCSSPDSIARAVGADILAQLGAGDGVTEYRFADQSEAKLVPLLRDPESFVVASALYALGHLERGDPAAIAPLAKHASEDVRCALAYALGGRPDDISIAALIQLSADDDIETRDWATFALGELSEKDTAGIRDALAARLGDDDDEVRGEAIAGLAKRRDRRAVQPLIEELMQMEVGALGTVGLMRHLDLLAHLEAFQEANPDDETIREAVNCCRTRVEDM